MRVHEIELLAFGDFVLLDGEREGVRGRLLEQGILELRDLMERHALGKAAEAERAGVRDEMNVVAAARELETELGRDGARATVGWIAGDADSHISIRSSVVSHLFPTFDNFTGQCFR